MSMKALIKQQVIAEQNARRTP